MSILQMIEQIRDTPRSVDVSDLHGEVLRAIELERVDQYEKAGRNEDIYHAADQKKQQWLDYLSVAMSERPE